MWCTGNGTDAQPWFRIFNPCTQQEKFDKDCEYIKHWLPELKDVPVKDIHNWYKPEVHEKWLNQGVKYYKPILDHDEERKVTLKLYKEGLK
jgi:deoxyribodipyrimidine photo-lyase